MLPFKGDKNHDFKNTMRDTAQFSVTDIHIPHENKSTTSYR